MDTKMSIDMSLDPAEKFIMMSISREDIAWEFNDYIPDDKDPLDTDDSRLTQKFCKQYANKLGELYEDDLDEEERVAYKEELIAKMWKKL